MEYPFTIKEIEMPKSFSHDTPDPIRVTISLSLEVAGLSEASQEDFAKAFKEIIDPA
jgi:hypothetical protein